MGVCSLSAGILYLFGFFDQAQNAGTSTNELTVDRRDLETYSASISNAQYSHAANQEAPHEI
jgi:hypothetical protein